MPRINQKHASHERSTRQMFDSFKTPIHLWAVRHSYISKSNTNPAAHQLNCPSAHQLESSRTNTPVNPLACQLINLPRHPINLQPCQLFGTNFNIMSALSGNQSPTLPQKIDSREGSFWCKKGLAPACSKMYFYLNRPPLTAVFRPFSAKWSTFCR